MLVRLLGKEAEAKAGDWDIPFDDVADWAAPYVGYAYANGITDGVGGSKFGGTQTIDATQYLTLVLRALGYSSATDFKWNAAWELSDKIGFTNGEYNAENTAFLRSDIALISVDVLDVTLKDSETTLYESISDALNASASFDEMISDISARHKALVTSIKSFNGIEKCIVSDTSTASLLSADEIAILTTEHGVKETITYAEAAADVDVFFRAFKSAYGGYYYFGEVSWDETKAEIMTWLKGRASVSRSEFEAALADAMDFLQDAHVGIGGVDRGIDLEYEYYYCDGQNYKADETGYYKTIGGEKWYFVSLSDSRVTMERSLTAGGEVVYPPCFSALCLI